MAMPRGSSSARPTTFRCTTAWPTSWRRWTYSSGPGPERRSGLRAEDAPGIVPDGRQPDRPGLQDRPHVDRVAAGVVEHGPGPGLLQRVGRRLALRSDRGLGHVLDGERLAADLLEDAHHLERAQGLRPTDLEGGVARRRAVQALPGEELGRA